jgi:hypothetical protein
MATYNVPGRADVHVDRPLTNISIAFRQSADAFVADKVFPVVPVQKQSDTFFTIPRGAFFRDQVEKKAPGAEPAKANFNYGTDSYRADIWALATGVADEIRANYDSPLSADRDMTEFLTHQGLIRKERLFASEFFTTGKWTTDYTGVAATPTGAQFLQWNDANSNPIEDIRAGKRRVHGRTGFRPNKMIVGREVYDVLLDHPDIVGRLDRGQTTGPAMAKRDELAALFELDEILVMDAIYNTANEGATDSYAFIGGKSALLVYSAPSPGLMVPTGGYTFSWTGLLGGGANGMNMRRIRDDKAQADELIVQMAFDMKLISADLGQFFTAAIA